MADDGGIGRLERRLAAIPKKIRDDVQPALDRNANELAGLMRRLAPDDPETGAPDLKSSIKIEMGETELRRAVVAGGEATTKDGYDYAFAQELGTTATPASPFFYPAKRLLAKKIRNSLKSAVRRSVRKNWGGG